MFFIAYAFKKTSVCVCRTSENCIEIFLSPAYLKANVFSRTNVNIKVHSLVVFSLKYVIVRVFIGINVIF